MIPLVALLTPAHALVADLPFERQGGWIWVAMTAQGRRVDAILDSGAGESVVDSGLARRLGARARGGRRFFGIGPESVRGTEVVGAVARLAGTSLDVGLGQALPLGGVRTKDGRHPDAILGFDFLYWYVVEIDDAASRLRIYDREAYRPPEGYARLPVEFVDRLPTVRGTLRLPGGEGRERTLMIDTGSASGINVLYRTFRREHLDRSFPDRGEDASVGGVGGVRAVRPIGTLEGRLGPVPVSGPGRLIVQGTTARRASGLDYDYDATVGNAALRGLDLVFDYSRGALYVRASAVPAR